MRHVVSHRTGAALSLMKASSMCYLNALAIATSLLCCPTRMNAEDCQKDNASARTRHPGASLSLAWLGTNGRPVLRMTLKNLGPRPIVVDKALVFCVYVETYAEDGQPIGVDVALGKQLPQPAQVAVRQRFITLSPGQEIKREVDLTRGFTTFDTAIATNQVGLHSAIAASETAQVLRDSKRLRSVRVKYSQPYSFSDGFRLYTGSTPNDVGLYSEELCASINLAAK